MKYSLVILCMAVPALGAEPSLAIRNANIETLAKDGRIEKATIVIRNGKIDAVGKDVAIPDDARIIDAAGGTLMPGFIDPLFEIPVATANTEAPPRTITVGNRTITLPGGAGQPAGGFTRIADNFYPYAAGYKPLPRSGMARLNLVTNGSGQSAVVRVTPNEPDHMMDRPDGVAFISITNSSTSLDQLRNRLDGGRGGVGQPGGGRGGGGRFGGGGFGGFGGGANVGAKLWADVKEGKAPLIVSAANGAAIVHVLKIIESHDKVKLTLFASGSAFAEAADALKGRNVRAIVHPDLALLPNTRDRFAPARLLNELGIEVALSLNARPQAAGTELAAPPPDERPPIQDFPLFSVAMLVKSGLPRQHALEALTKKPAMILGMEETHGTIETGKVADLVLFTGDPLDPMSQLRLMLIDGRTTHASE